MRIVNRQHQHAHGMRGVGAFTPAAFPIPQTPVRGMGDFARASFPVPQNPVLRQLAGLGDFATARFPVPQNPVGLGGCGCGSGCSGGPNFYGMNGMGDFSLTSVTTWLQAPSMVSTSVPNWMVWGGVAAGAYFLMGKKGRR